MPIIDPALISALITVLKARYDRAAWLTIASPHLHVRVGNDAPSTDRPSSLDKIGALMARIDAIGGNYCEVWVRRTAMIAETEIAFHDARGCPAVIPCIVIARFADARVVDLRFVCDPSPIP